MCGLERGGAESRTVQESVGSERKEDGGVLPWGKSEEGGGGEKKLQWGNISVPG